MLKEIMKTAFGGAADEPEIVEAAAEPDPHTVTVWAQSNRQTKDLARMHWAGSGAVWTPNTVMLGLVLAALHEKGYGTSLTRHRNGTNTVNFSF
jgi:hypothetical protein